MKPSIFVPPIPEKPLLLYLTTTDTTMGALLAQYLEETKKENAIYYISKKMLSYEEKYSPLEKTCLYGQPTNSYIICLLTRFC